MKLCVNTNLQVIRAGLAVLFIAAANISVAGADTVVDCPLRDEPYSINTPLMDLLLKPEAVTVINRHMDGMLDNMPENFMRTEAPSFSAIVTLPNLLAMGGVTTAPPQALVSELAALDITDADRIARCARYDVEVLSISREEDLALVRLHLDDAATVPAVELGASAPLPIGSSVILGLPLIIISATTIAVTASSQRSWGRPTTAALATSGCSRRSRMGWAM